MVGMVFAHLLLAWSWIATQSRRLFGAVTAVIFSGILISQKAIPTLSCNALLR